MDHRAVKQAEKINSSNSPVLQYCGGSVSPEMEPPKVQNMWRFWSYFLLAIREKPIFLLFCPAAVG